jgi:hypothetical protein
MKKFSGIDLHSNNSVVVVSDEVDHIVYQRRLPNDALQIRAALAPQRRACFGPIRQHFALKRYLVRASLYRKQLAARFVAWCEITDATRNPACAF